MNLYAFSPPPAGFYVVKAINKVEPLQLQQRLIIR